MEKKIELTTIKGTKVQTTIEVVRGFETLSVNLDGDVVSTSRFAESTNVTTAIAGLVVSGGFSTSLYRGTPAGVVAQITDVVKKVQINLDAIQYGIYKSTLDAMVAEEESKPEVAAYREMCWKNEAESRDYDRFTRRVENAMTLNGKTY